MGVLYLTALRTAVRRWRIVLLLFVANLAAGMGFTAVAWWWLALALDNSLATRTLLTDLDMNVFIDLFVHHGDSLQMLGIAAALAAFAFAILGVWLNAAASVAVATEAAVSECARRGWTVFATHLRLWVLATALNVASVAAGFVVARGLTRWTAESPAEMTYYWAAGAGFVLGAVLLCFFTTVHDHARIRSVATKTGAVSAYGWAIAFVARRERRALPVASLLFATGFVSWVVYQSVGMLIVTHSAPGVALSLLWGETLLVGRKLLRVGCFAAAAELQSARQGHA